MWASAELTSRSCSLARRDGRKRSAERYQSGSDKPVGEGTDGKARASRKDECRWLGGSVRGRTEEHIRTARWFDGAGRSFPHPPGGRKAQLCQRTGYRHGPAAAPLHWLSSWATLHRVAFMAAAAHEYAICWYIRSRPVIPLQPCGYVAFHFAEKACQNSFKNEIKAFLVWSFKKKKVY